MSEQQQAMCYVAADPKQPGAAWAIVVDDGKYLDDLANTLADWVMRGAQVKHVNYPTGHAMLCAWVRPSA